MAEVSCYECKVVKAIEKMFKCDRCGEYVCTNHYLRYKNEHYCDSCYDRIKKLEE